jgi:hypothetical protein
VTLATRSAFAKFESYQAALCSTQIHGGPGAEWEGTSKELLAALKATVREVAKSVGQLRPGCSPAGCVAPRLGCAELGSRPCRQRRATRPEPGASCAGRRMSAIPPELPEATRINGMYLGDRPGGVGRPAQPAAQTPEPPDMPLYANPLNTNEGIFCRIFPDDAFGSRQAQGGAGCLPRRH